MDKTKKAQDLAFKIGEIINGQDIDIVKLALMGIWDLVHELENGMKDG